MHLNIALTSPCSLPLGASNTVKPLMDFCDSEWRLKPFLPHNMHHLVSSTLFHILLLFLCFCSSKNGIVIHFYHYWIYLITLTWSHITIICWKCFLIDMNLSNLSKWLFPNLSLNPICRVCLQKSSPFSFHYPLTRARLLPPPDQKMRIMVYIHVYLLHVVTWNTDAVMSFCDMGSLAGDCPIVITGYPDGVSL